MTSATAVFATLAAFLASYGLCLVLFRVAALIGFTDKPDDGHKQHERPTPLLGGVAVYLAFAGVLLWVAPEVNGIVLAMLVAPGLMCLLGVYDDRFAVRARTKFLGQMLICIPLAYALPGPSVLDVFGYQIDVGLLGPPLFAFWLLTCTNAVNLLDGLDGMVASVGIAICISLTGLSLYGSGSGEVQELAAITPVLLAACLLGFLCVNWFPARMYLGDAGSLTVGLLLGLMTADRACVVSSTSGDRVVLIPLLLIMFAVPLADVTFAMARRLLQSRSIAEADREHFHHQLTDYGFSVPKAALIAAAVTGSCGLCGVIGLASGSMLAAFVGCLAVFAVLAAAEIFGRREFALLMDKVAPGRASRPRTQFHWESEHETAGAVLRCVIESAETGPIAVTLHREHGILNRRDVRLVSETLRSAPDFLGATASQEADLDDVAHNATISFPDRAAHDQRREAA